MGEAALDRGPRAQRARFDQPRGLRRDDFSQIAKHGFGDPNNGIAHCASEYGGKIFVGVSRCNLELIAADHPPTTAVWPARRTDSENDRDRRGQIWCLDPEGGALDRWRRVYTSPSPDGSDRGHPMDIGYRDMAVYRAARDAAPRLYACPWPLPDSPAAPELLRCDDGEVFERIPIRGLGDDGPRSFHVLRAFNGRLFAAVDDYNVEGGPAARVYVSDDPGNGTWRAASAVGFGDTDNLGISALASFDGNLYAATVNPNAGFQIWKTRAEGEAPFHWHRVVASGAGRGRVNELVTGFCVHGDMLYAATGIRGAGYDKLHHIGPAAAELIRLRGDDAWDLVIGTPRRGNRGPREPLGELGPGFGSLVNALLWGLASFEGWLYVGTYNWACYLPYLSGEHWPNTLKKQIQKIGVNNLVSSRGGFDLWRSRDGECWTAVTVDGFGNPYNSGARVLLPTSHGLVLGTTNTFGPEVGLRVASGEWTYGFNPTSGLEMWLGRAGGGALEGHAGEENPASLSLQAKSLREEYDVRMYEPLIDEYYENSGFYSWGIWGPETASQKQACEDLMEWILGRIPDKRGRILDVACGKGATTRHLLRYYEPSQITACDISEKLLETCRENAPGCDFRMMDAADLRFADETFDAVVCVDGAALFDTRQDFLQEAFCVLKPGGHLVISDRLLSPEAAHRLRNINRENYIPSLVAYRQLFEHIGFHEVNVKDIANERPDGYPERFADFVCRKYLADEIDEEMYNGLMSFALSRLTIVKHYVLVHARKPMVVSPSTPVSGER